MSARRHTRPHGRMRPEPVALVPELEQLLGEGLWLADIAARLGVHEQTPRLWRRGVRQPGPSSRAKLRRLTRKEDLSMNASQQGVLIASRLSPMSTARQIAHVGEGQTVAEIVDSLLEHEWQRDGARVSMDGYEVDRGLWSTTVPKAGSSLAVTVVPGDSTNLLRAGLIIALVVAAVYTGGAAAGAIPGVAAGSATSIAISAGVGAAVPTCGPLALALPRPA